ncbi:unnamed protein product, partial [Mycena citricolor]
MHLQVKSFVFTHSSPSASAFSSSSQVSSYSSPYSTCADAGPLKMTAKRYRAGNSSSNTEGITLVLGHGVGSHKEAWEPLLRDIFARQQNSYPRVREAWALDRQDHGDAAVLNGAEIQKSRPGGVSSDEWSEAIAAFISSPRMRDHQIVTISHSAGAISMVNTAQFLNLRRSPYIGMILVEPTIVGAELDPYREGGIEMLTGAIRARRDKWPSAEALHEWMGARFPWSDWDPRVLKAHVDHGFKSSSETNQITLKCNKLHEANAFLDKPAHFSAVDRIARLCRHMPLHVIWGTQDDIVPEAGKASISDHNKGRYVASVTRMEGESHMIVQENPSQLAVEVCR